MQKKISDYNRSIFYLIGSGVSSDKIEFHKIETHVFHKVDTIDKSFHKIETCEIRSFVPYSLMDY